VKVVTDKLLLILGMAAGILVVCGVAILFCGLGRLETLSQIAKRNECKDRD
jgi:hypothetical protein